MVQKIGKLFMVGGFIGFAICWLWIGYLTVEITSYPTVPDDARGYTWPEHAGKSPTFYYIPYNLHWLHTYSWIPVLTSIGLIVYGNYLRRRPETDF